MRSFRATRRLFRKRSLPEIIITPPIDDYEFIKPPSLPKTPRKSSSSSSSSSASNEEQTEQLYLEIPSFTRTRIERLNVARRGLAVGSSRFNCPESHYLLDEDGFNMIHRIENGIERRPPTPPSPDPDDSGPSTPISNDDISESIPIPNADVHSTPSIRRISLQDMSSILSKKVFESFGRNQMACEHGENTESTKPTVGILSLASDLLGRDEYTREMTEKPRPRSLRKLWAHSLSFNLDEI